MRAIARRAALLLLTLAAAVGACTADDASRAKRDAGGASVAQVPSNTDACGLLSAADLQAVQGERLRQQKGSEQAGGALKVSQCFFELPTYAKSVTLAIATGATKEYWRKLQGTAENERERRESPQQAELREELYRPQPVSGVGQQALWLRSRFGGSLYVLQGETLLIVSVGGNETEPSRIGKSKLLAARALRRLAT